MTHDLSLLLKEFPPVLCRLLARHNTCAISGRQLARYSGLSRSKIDHLSQLNSWDTVKVADALAFMSVCGVNLLNARRQREFIRRANWKHLDKSPGKQYYQKLMRGLYEEQTRKNEIAN